MENTSYQCALCAFNLLWTSTNLYSTPLLCRSSHGVKPIVSHQNTKWIQATKQNKNIVCTWQKCHLASTKAHWLTHWQENRLLYLYAWTRISLLISADLALICACLCWIYLNANWFAAHPFEQIEIWVKSLHPSNLPSTLAAFLSAREIKAKPAVISEGLRVGREVKWTGN